MSLLSQRPARSASPAANPVFPGPYTSGNDRDLVVFLIGMRFNSWRSIRQIAGAFMAMPRMLESLAKNPETGCLGGHVAFGWRTAYVMQYWRSYDDLERFAKTPDDEHLPAWRWYNKLGDKARGAGIWHETFKVAAGAYESIYVNMPNFGLAAATTHERIGPATRGSRQRIETPVAVEA